MTTTGQHPSMPALSQSLTMLDVMEYALLGAYLIEGLLSHFT